MGKAPMRITPREGGPSVPFLGLTEFPESVRGRVMPPNPVGIEGLKPIAKGGRQLAMGVAGKDEQRLEHGLPRCLGLAARGFEVGPAGSTKDV